MDSVDYYDFSNNMAKLNRSITSFVNKGLEKHNLTRSEVPYLMTLYKHESVTQEFFSRYYDLNEGTITRALVRLEKKGFIKRVSNPDDKRKRMVSLTDEGLELSVMLIDYQKHIKEQVYYNFTDEEYNQLVELLNKMFENINNILE